MNMPALQFHPAEVYHLPKRQPAPRHPLRHVSKWLKSNWFMVALALFMLIALVQSAQITQLRDDTDLLQDSVTQLSKEAESVAARYEEVMESYH